MKYATTIVALLLGALLTATPAHAQVGGDADEITAVTRHLDLSADQQKKVQKVQDDLRKSLARTRAAIEVASIDLRRELEKSDADESRVGAQIDAIAKLEGTARKERIFAMLRIKKLLTAEQRAKLERLGSGHARAPRAPRAPRVPRSAADVLDFDGDLDIHFDFAPGDFQFDFDIDSDKLDAETRKQLEKARKQIEKAHQQIERDTRRAVKDAERARDEAMREARQAMKEAQRAMQEAERERERERERAERLMKAVGKTGQLMVAASPHAEILIDGKKMGTTPLHLNLPAGNHKMTTVFSNGEKKTTTIKVRAGETVSVKMRSSR